MARRLSLVLLLVTILLAAIFLLQRYTTLPSLKDLFSEQPVTIDQSPLLVKQIKEMAQLMTIEFYDEVVVDSSKNGVRLLSPGGGLFPIPPLMLPGSASLVLVVKGRVLAGIDLQQVREQNIQTFKDSIFIQLPQAQILDVIINPSGVETFAEKGNWTPKEVTAVKLKARQKMITDAHEQNVLQRANEKAKSVVENLLRSSGFEKVTVETAGKST